MYRGRDWFTCQLESKEDLAQVNQKCWNQIRGNYAILDKDPFRHAPEQSLATK